MKDRNVLLAILAGCIGAVVGFFTGHGLAKRKYEKLASTEIEEIRNFYKANQSQEKEEQKSNIVRRERENDRKSNSDEYSKFRKLAAKYDDPDQTSHLAEREYPDDDEENDDDYEAFPESKMSMDPFVISEEEFSTSHLEYDKLTASYYTKDDVLCDDQEQIIVDIGNTVGSDALESFGVDSGNKNIVYVRNHALATDYEVTKIEGSYAIDVCGDFYKKR